MHKKIFFLFSALLLVFAIALFFEVRPSFSPDPNPVLLQVAEGSSTRHIAELLAREKIIHSPVTFRFLALLSGKSKSLKHGTYLLERNHYLRTIDKLAQGLVYKIKATIPEGWSAYQIAEKLCQLGVIEDAESFFQWSKKNGYEGMLFPETYFFEPRMKDEAVAREMIQQFRKNYSDEFTRRAQELRMTETDVVIMASIIEREAKIDSERAIVSSVYHNRLKKKWPLAACPSVQYALSEGKYWKEVLTYKDLEVKSPYNTYHHIGLPPAPICSPGLKSIHAALYPADSRFLFFVADGKGGHNFFLTYQDHIQSQVGSRRNRKAGAQLR